MATLTTRLRLAAIQPLPRPISRVVMNHGLPNCTRTFTSTTSRHKARSETPQQMKQPTQRAMTLAMKDQRKEMVMPDDIGLLPDTFIPPYGSSSPSPLTSPRAFITLLRPHLYQTVKNLGATLYMKLVFIRNPRLPTSPTSDPLPPGSPLTARFKHFCRRAADSYRRIPDLQRWRIRREATQLYSDMYNHFAAGSLETMRPRLCENLYTVLETRLSSRPSHIRTYWCLHGWVRRPRVVSHRLVPLEMNATSTTRTCIQQAVVRMVSKQSLRRMTKVARYDGAPIPTWAVVDDEGGRLYDEGGKEVVENFVVQRMLRKGVWGPWKAWGTTESMTLMKWKEMQRGEMSLLPGKK